MCVCVLAWSSALPFKAGGYKVVATSLVGRQKMERQMAPSLRGYLFSMWLRRTIS